MEGTFFTFPSRISTLVSVTYIYWTTYTANRHRIYEYPSQRVGCGFPSQVDCSSHRYVYTSICWSRRIRIFRGRRRSLPLSGHEEPRSPIMPDSKLSGRPIVGLRCSEIELSASRSGKDRSSLSTRPLSHGSWACNLHTASSPACLNLEEEWTSVRARSSSRLDPWRCATQLCTQTSCRSGFSKWSNWTGEIQGEDEQMAVTIEANEHPELDQNQRT